MLNYVWLSTLGKVRRVLSRGLCPGAVTTGHVTKVSRGIYTAHFAEICMSFTAVHPQQCHPAAATRYPTRRAQQVVAAVPCRWRGGGDAEGATGPADGVPARPIGAVGRHCIARHHARADPGGRGGHRGLLRPRAGQTCRQHAGMCPAR